jgi:peptide/nickel transport system ATP-binding protein
VLRALAGLLRPASGHLRLGDVEVWAGRRPRLPRPGYVMPVFQDVGASLDPRWTISRSVAEALPGPEDRAERVHELLTRVGLSEVDPERKPGELSGGQRQRVVLARALAGSPALIVADEPTAQLDPTIAAGVTEAMRAAVDSGCALVVVSHDVARLRGLCDRVFRLAGATLHADP